MTIHLVLRRRRQKLAFNGSYLESERGKTEKLLEPAAYQKGFSCLLPPWNGDVRMDFMHDTRSAISGLQKNCNSCLMTSISLLPAHLSFITIENGGVWRKSAGQLGMLKIMYLCGTHLGCLGKRDQSRNQTKWQSTTRASSEQTE